MNKKIIIISIAVLVLISGCVQVEEGKTFTLSGLTADKVLITQAVPKYETGESVTNYATAFETKTINVDNGKATITLGENPVFIELGPEAYPKASLNGYANSPFGFLDDPRPKVLNYMKDLGAHWIRVSAGSSIAWPIIEKEEGEYDWEVVDREIEDMSKSDVLYLFNILAFADWDAERCAEKNELGKYTNFPCDIEAYKNFLSEAARRYKGRIKYYQFWNEYNPGGWTDTSEKLAELIKITYETIKSVDPDAIVVLGGQAQGKRTTGLDLYYLEVLQYLDNIKENNEKYFDVFDFHVYGFDKAEYHSDVKTIYSGLRNKLDSLDYQEIPIWITETSTYSDTPVSFRADLEFEKHTENQQADALLKAYVTAVSLGVKKTFWASSIEWAGFGGESNGIWDNMGLINNPANDGKSHKKLAYYTYKLMTEKLEGSNWNNVETIIDGEDNIYVYKFTRKDLNKPVYVAWYDSFEEEEKIEEKKPAEKEKPEEKPEEPEGKCGDGVCDDFEQQRKELCPEDCQ